MDETAKPLFLSLTAGGHEDRYPVERGKPVAMQVPPAHLFEFSITLLWSDNSQSDFGEFFGCSKLVNKGSGDGHAG